MARLTSEEIRDQAARVKMRLIEIEAMDQALDAAYAELERKKGLLIAARFELKRLMFTIDGEHEDDVRQIREQAGATPAAMAEAYGSTCRKTGVR